MKRRKPGKALERTARDIKDSDEFMTHVANIAELYRREHALDSTPRGGAVRQSLKAFGKHAGALSQWLEQAHKGNPSAPEYEALGKLGALLYGAPHQAVTASRSVAEWLRQAEAATRRYIEENKSFARKAQRNAPKAAGAALRATFEHHKLKFAAQATADKPSAAVRLLCAIAKSAGDPELTPAAAKQALVESGVQRRGKAAH
jgi:hypothetical protein